MTRFTWKRVLPFKIHTKGWAGQYPETDNSVSESKLLKWIGQRFKIIMLNVSKQIKKR